MRGCNDQRKLAFRRLFMGGHMRELWEVRIPGTLKEDYRGEDGSPENDSIGLVFHAMPWEIPETINATASGCPLRTSSEYWYLSLCRCCFANPLGQPHGFVGVSLDSEIPAIGFPSL